MLQFRKKDVLQKQVKKINVKKKKKNRNESTSNPCTIYLTDRLQSIG